MHIWVYELIGFPLTVRAVKQLHDTFLGILNDFSHLPAVMARNSNFQELKAAVVDFEPTLIETARSLRQHFQLAKTIFEGYLKDEVQTSDWQWWDSNPRLLRDWSLNPAP